MPDGSAAGAGKVEKGGEGEGDWAPAGRAATVTARKRRKTRILRVIMRNASCGILQSITNSIIINFESLTQSHFVHKNNAVNNVR